MVGINGAASAQRLDARELLGATRIGGSGFDRDAINVGNRRGHFEKSRVRARSNGVYVRSLRVVCGNHETQDIRMGGGVFEKDSRPLRLNLRAQSALSSSSSFLTAQSRPYGANPSCVSLAARNIDTR